MMTIRRSADRGHAEHGWLESHHSFSFAGYFDPDQMGFRSLRVINEDRVEPGRGFDAHSHRDMEIVTVVLGGALEHKDSMGNGSVIRPGDVQRMSAGTGVSHSEFNASSEEGVHFLQIWILPEADGLAPSYEQRHFSAAERRGRLRLVASPDGRDGSVKVHQQAAIHMGSLDAGDTIEHEPSLGGHAWLQVTRGRIRVGRETLGGGDGAAISDASRIEIEALEASEVLVFDLA